jgi:hypothetical protein
VVDEQMMQAMAAQQGAPQQGMPMEQAPDGDALIMALLQAVMGGIQGKEAEADQEREALAQSLMALLAQQQGPAVDPMMGYAEGAQAPVAEGALG